MSGEDEGEKRNKMRHERTKERRAEQMKNERRG